MLKVHIVLDLGWEDSLSAGLVQKNMSEVRVIEYLEAYQTTLPVFFHEISTRGYNWGKVFLPHDGFAKTLNAEGKSTEDILKALGWTVKSKDETVIVSQEEGIRNARIVFPRVYFNESLTAADKAPDKAVAGFSHTKYSNRLIEVLKRYQRRVNKQHGGVGSPVHNEFSHGADMFRYLCLNVDGMSNDTGHDITQLIRRRKSRNWMAA